MQMLPFLLSGQCRQFAEPERCRLEDRLQKAAKRLREEVALPVSKKLRHQGERSWRNWSGEEKTAAVQLVKTAGYNHLRLKRGKDTPPKATVWSWGRQMQEAEKHQPLRGQCRPQTPTAMEEATVVKYMNPLIEQGLRVDSRTLRVRVAACNTVWYSATHQQQNSTRHQL